MPGGTHPPADAAEISYSFLVSPALASLYSEVKTMGRKYYHHYYYLYAILGSEYASLRRLQGPGVRQVWSDKEGADGGILCERKCLKQVRLWETNRAHDHGVGLDPFLC